ncbi:MAG: response regulator transcription factor [Anaerovoracaceae bacterium]|nr:response regulator transcription factor [Anaerovoracaceae bacterium]
MYRIYIVEDDRDIAGVLKKHISSWGFEVACSENFQNILAEFVDFDPQLVLMDITLPFFNGYHWCSEIRKFSRVPIVFLSSAADNMNMIMAMNMGADDFISKPFDLQVLTAKLQAILRRTYDFGGQMSVLEHRGAVLNLSDGSLAWQGRKVELTKNEQKILQCLLESRGTVVSRQSLMERLWATDSFVDENTLTVNVNRLRKRLEQTGLTDFITTRKGMGYIIE